MSPSVAAPEAQKRYSPAKCIGVRSEKLANHEAAVALHFMHYNFVRIHQTLRVTPAMAAGVTISYGRSTISRRFWTDG